MDGEGFEPPVLHNNTPVFKTGTFNRSDTHPKSKRLRWASSHPRQELKQRATLFAIVERMKNGSKFMGH